MRLQHLSMGLLLWTCPVLFAQETLPEKSLVDDTIFSTTEEAALRQGLAKVTEQVVRETISYLASDELEGRDTLSKGYDQAAQYVAQRFEQAGLQPVVGEAYYHVTPIAAIRLPVEGVVITNSQQAAVENFGLLGSSVEAVQYSGKLSLAELNDTEFQLEQPGPVVCPWPSETGTPRVVNQIVRAANRFRAAGATALILRVPRTSELIEAAKRAQGTVSLDNPRASFNLPVLLVPDDIELKADEDYQLSLPGRESLQAEARNVIAILPGSDPELSQEYVIFSAHLDHIGMAATGENRIFNGADDNATGVTAVLSLADAFGALPERPKRSLVFMTFWGEERGLLGSRAFVRDPSIPLDKVVANINIEMIGRPEDGAYGKVWVTGWDKSNIGSLMNETSQAVGVDIFEHPRFSNMLYGSSDNFAFAEAGVIAHSFSAGSLHEDYHQVTDEWEKLNLPHMTKVIQGLFAGSWRLAQGQATPAKTAPAAGR